MVIIKIPTIFFCNFIKFLKENQENNFINALVIECTPKPTTICMIELFMHVLDRSNYNTKQAEYMYTWFNIDI